MVTLVVHYRTKPSAVDAVAKALHELMALTRAESGCVRYVVAQALDDPTRFILFEQYSDEEALEKHSTSNHFTRIVIEELAPSLEERVRERYVTDQERTGTDPCE